MNIYYKNVLYNIGNITNINKFDATLGSNIFSINYYVSNQFGLEDNYPSNAIYILRNSDDYVNKFNDISKKANDYYKDKIMRDNLFVEAVNKGHIDINRLNDNSYIIDIIGKDSFVNYHNESFRKSGLNDLITNQDYRALLNKTRY